MNRSKWVILLILIAMPTLMRITGKPWNFAPVGAIALFVGAHLRNKWLALILPLAALFMADAYLGWEKGDYEVYTFHVTAPFTYACILLYIVFGMGIRTFWCKTDQRNSETGPMTAQKAAAVPVGALAGAIGFFLITNFGSWAMFNSYPHTFSGLLLAYDAGLPFFRGTLAGDLFFAAILFGGYELLRQNVPAWQRSPLMFANES